MTVRIRQAALADLDRLAPLFDGYRRFYKQPADLPLARTFLAERLARGESAILLAEDGDGNALGFTQLYPSFSSVSACRIWILNDLFVTPTGRGQGVGRALLDAAKSHARASGAKRLTLSTAHDNPAQRLYEAHGYQRDREFLHYSLALD